MQDEILRVETEYGIMCFSRMSDSVHTKWCFDHGPRLDFNNVAHVGEFHDKPFYDELWRFLRAPFEKQSNPA